MIVKAQETRIDLEVPYHFSYSLLASLLRSVLVRNREVRNYQFRIAVFVAAKTK